jgi:hypothetical protein
MRDDRLWPFDIRVAVLWAPILFIILVVGLALLRQLVQWPPPALDQWVLLAILLVSLLPVLLAVLDLVAERGGAVSFRGVTLDFSAARAAPSYAVPHNIGLPGTPVSDSGTENIVEALRGAATSEVIVVDLEDGDAWWETRLLVLIAGAARLGSPDAVVFVAADGGVRGRFQGWAAPSALLPPLLRADRRYRETYHRAKAWAGRWDLAEPAVTPQPAAGRARPPEPPPPKLPAAITAPHPRIAVEDGLPSAFAFERLLQSELGMHVEEPEKQKPRTIGIFRLEELFRPVLRTSFVDEDWLAEQKVEAILATEEPFIAVTQAGRYLRLIPRVTGLAAVLRSVATPGRRAG